jgi:hypothetical protein
MKRFLITTSAALLIAGTINAQHSSQHSTIGIKGGLNVYNVNYENNSDSKSRVGFHAGLLGHLHLAPQLALQPEVVYSQQGAKSEFQGVETKLNLGYVNVPILVQYMFDNGFRLQAGPQIGFLLGAKTEIGNTEIDIKDQLKPIDFGIGAGIGYVDPSSGFGVDARYNLGLSNINDDANAQKAYNRGFQLGVFYLFKHK